MSLEPTTLAHFAAGGATLGLYWATLSRRKGSAAHRRAGRIFLLSWLPLLASVAAVLFWSHRDFSAPEVVQFVYLSVCIVVVASTAWRALRLKDDLDRFRGTGFKAGGIVMTLMAIGVLASGVASGQILPVAFSSIGLIFGPAMLHFAWRRDAIQPRWALGWHLNAVTFLFNAVHGTLLTVALRAFVWPQAGDELGAAMHGATLAIALALRLWFGARFNAPMRMGLVARPALP